MENELCLEHRNHMKTLPWSPRKICVLLCFQSFLCTKHQIFFFKWKFFLFKELSKIFKDFGGDFKDFSRISNNFSIQGVFKDMTLFQGLFRARVSHVSVNIKNNAEKDKSGSFQIKPWVAFRLPYLLIELFFIGVPMVSKVGWTYGHVTIKIYRMHRSPNVLTHGAPL